MNQLSRRSLFAVGLGLVAGCSTTKSLAGPDAPSTTLGPQNNDGSLPQPRVQIDSLAMVGDSITEGSAGELRELLGDGDLDLDLDLDEVVIDGVARRRIAVGSRRNGETLSGVGAVEEIIESGFAPSVWVIALGTNDVGGLGTPENCAELIDKILVLVPPPGPLVWVNVYRPSDLRETRLFNRVLGDVLATRGSAVVADWYSIASDPDQDVLRSDNLHPNDDGQFVFAELVVQALQRL